MPLEIEIKLKVPSHDAIRQRLEEIGAQRLGLARETNIFFDRPDGSLRAADSGLRVRLTSQGGNSSPAALLTFKGPPAKTGLRSREAYDLTVTPRAQLIPLLESLGFERQYAFEKDRESWQLDHCNVELDTLPHFGTFLEIEGPSEQAVHAVQEKLALANLPPHKESYAHMVSELLDKSHVTGQELEFPGKKEPP